MVIFGWLALVAIALYVTFGFIAGTIVSLGFGGRAMGLLVNTLGCLVILGLWYFVATQFPFEVTIK